MAFAYVADDEAPPEVVYGASAVVAEYETDVGWLEEHAISAQRLAVTRLTNMHVKGSMEVAVVDIDRNRTPEKMFSVPKLLEWTHGEPSVVTDALRAGRLRCRLSAKMGMGKSTILPSYIARNLGVRVLHVALNAHALQQVSDRIVALGIGRYSRSWSNVRGERLCCMTYADFNGYMNTSRRAQVFKCFDVIIFDEAFVNTADVYVAKKCFSVYAGAETSLILCSATIKTDARGDETGSVALGNFKHLSSEMSVDSAIESGKLFSDYLVDRSFVVLPDNESIYKLQEAYLAAGVDVKILDDASTNEMKVDVEEWMIGDATIPRVAIVCSLYGIAFNFPVSYVIVFPYESAYKIDANVVTRVYEPMSEEMVTQVKSRSGRGIIQGSGGVVMSPERVVATELKDSEKMLAFVKLCAASIIPLRNSFWEKPFELFPDGLSIPIAQTLLKVCLPIEVTTRYLAADGLIARKYCHALNVFAHPNHFLVASKYDEPANKAQWVDETIVGSGEFGGTVSVPMIASGELQIILQAVSMFSSGHINIPRWRSEHVFSLGDGYDSDEEVVVKKPASVFTMRRIENAKKPLPEVPKQIETIPWAYRPIEGSEGLRRGGYIDSERCKEALMSLDRNLLEYARPTLEFRDISEEPEGSVVNVKLASDALVESPGGSTVCKIPVGICEKMNCGELISPEEMVRVIVAAKPVVDRFVASKFFDCLSGPWDSVLRSLLDDDVVKLVVKRGYASDAYSIVDRMRGRFGLELLSVLSNSNVFKKTYLGMFSKLPSTDKIMRAIRKGKFDGIAQTDAFINRVKCVKELIDTVLVHAEQANVYLPSYITRAQRELPLRGGNVIGYVGESVVPMPSSWREKIGGVVEREERRYVTGKKGEF